MVSISGVRGIVGTTLTPEVVVKYASAYAEYCKKGAIVLGRDGRITGQSIGHIVSSTLLQMGCDVRAIGVCPTPTVALAVEKLSAKGGIAITASHNPMQWNGLKFFASDGFFLDSEQNKELWKIADRPRHYAAWDKQGKHEPIEGFIDQHVQEVLSLSYVRPEKIRRKRFKVVLDCVNASGGVIVPKLLRKLGCKVVEMNCDVSGVFAHMPEPVPENLLDLCSKVKREKADLGIAVDPDADRLVLINERGEPFGEEYTLATVVKFVLEKESKRKRIPLGVTVNLSTTRAIDDIARGYNAAVKRTAVGEIHVAKEMKKNRSVIGGEGNGGVILPELHYGRDALVGIALILQYLAESGGTLSDLKAGLPQYVITKGKVDLGNINAENALLKIREKHAGRGRVNTDDGLKIDFENSWIHLRKSNTEPIVRIIAEAPDRALADELVRAFTHEILSS